MSKRTNRTKAVFRNIIYKSFSDSDITDSGKSTEKIPLLNHSFFNFVDKKKNPTNIQRGNMVSLLLAKTPSTARERKLS